MNPKDQIVDTEEESSWLFKSILEGIKAQVPKLFRPQDLSEKFPRLYEESMNTVLVQELYRYNGLIQVMQDTIRDQELTIEGLISSTVSAEILADSLLNNQVPAEWSRHAYPSLKSLTSWLNDLNERIHMFLAWIADGQPKAFWISGFFFTQSFLTGIYYIYIYNIYIYI